MSSSPTVTDEEFQEVSWSSWAKFQNKWDTVQWVFIEHFTKEAREQFGEQIVAVLQTADWTVNVGLPASNPRYLWGIRKLIPWHNVRITLSWFFNQDTQTLSDVPWKTRKGTSFAKNYSILQSINPAPTAMQPLTVEDTPF